MPSIALVANKRSRGGASFAVYEPLARARGWRIYIVGDAPLDEQVADAVRAGCTTIAAAGGDGTISSVADAVVRRGDLRLGVVPAGTLNHFAKDLGLPLDLALSLDVIEEGHSRTVDVGCVNGRYFVNNSSVGFYPAIVETRRPLERQGVNGWVAFFWSIITLSWRTPSFTVLLGKKDALVAKRALSVFIGNNRYVFEGLVVGARPAIDEGLLFVAIIRRSAIARILSLAYRIVRGRLFEAPDVNAVGLAECTITSKKKRLMVSMDGEIMELATPLEYSIRPKALRVIAPTA